MDSLRASVLSALSSGTLADFSRGVDILVTKARESSAGGNSADRGVRKYARELLELLATDSARFAPWDALQLCLIALHGLYLTIPSFEFSQIVVKTLLAQRRMVSTGDQDAVVGFVMARAPAAFKRLVASAADPFASLLAASAGSLLTSRAFTDNAVRATIAISPAALITLSVPAYLRTAAFAACAQHPAGSVVAASVVPWAAVFSRRSLQHPLVDAINPFAAVVAEAASYVAAIYARTVAPPSASSCATTAQCFPALPHEGPSDLPNLPLIARSASLSQRQRPLTLSRTLRGAAAVLLLHILLPLAASAGPKRPPNIDTIQALFAYAAADYENVTPKRHRMVELLAATAAAAASRLPPNAAAANVILPALRGAREGAAKLRSPRYRLAVAIAAAAALPALATLHSPHGCAMLSEVISTLSEAGESNGRVSSELSDSVNIKVDGVSSGDHVDSCKAMFSSILALLSEGWPARAALSILAPWGSAVDAATAAALSSTSTACSQGSESTLLGDVLPNSSAGPLPSLLPDVIGPWGSVSTSRVAVALHAAAVVTGMLLPAFEPQLDVPKYVSRDQSAETSTQTSRNTPLRAHLQCLVAMLPAEPPVVDLSDALEASKAPPNNTRSFRGGDVTKDSAETPVTFAPLLSANTLATLLFFVASPAAFLVTIGGFASKPGAAEVIAACDRLQGVVVPSSAALLVRVGASCLRPASSAVAVALPLRVLAMWAADCAVGSASKRLHGPSLTCAAAALGVVGLLASYPQTESSVAEAAAQAFDVACEMSCEADSESDKCAQGSIATVAAEVTDVFNIAVKACCVPQRSPMPADDDSPPLPAAPIARLAFATNCTRLTAVRVADRAPALLTLASAFCPPSLCPFASTAVTPAALKTALRKPKTNLSPFSNLNDSSVTSDAIAIALASATAAVAALGTAVAGRSLSALRLLQQLLPRAHTAVFVAGALAESSPTGIESSSSPDVRAILRAYCGGLCRLIGLSLRTMLHDSAADAACDARGEAFHDGVFEDENGNGVGDETMPTAAGGSYSSSAGAIRPIAADTYEGLPEAAAAVDAAVIFLLGPLLDVAPEAALFALLSLSIPAAVPEEPASGEVGSAVPAAIGGLSSRPPFISTHDTAVDAFDAPTVSAIAASAAAARRRRHIGRGGRGGRRQGERNNGAAVSRPNEAATVVSSHVAHLPNNATSLPSSDQAVAQAERAAFAAATAAASCREPLYAALVQPSLARDPLTFIVALACRAVARIKGHHNWPCGCATAASQAATAYLSVDTTPKSASSEGQRGFRVASEFGSVFSALPPPLPPASTATVASAFSRRSVGIMLDALQPAFVRALRDLPAAVASALSGILADDTIIVPAASSSSAPVQEESASAPSDPLPLISSDMVTFEEPSSLRAALVAAYTRRFLRRTVQAERALPASRREVASTSLGILTAVIAAHPLYALPSSVWPAPVEAVAAAEVVAVGAALVRAELRGCGAAASAIKSSPSQMATARKLQSDGATEASSTDVFRRSRAYRALLDALTAATSRSATTVSVSNSNLIIEAALEPEVTVPSAEAPPGVLSLLAAHSAGTTAALCAPGSLRNDRLYHSAYLLYGRAAAPSAVARAIAFPVVASIDAVAAQIQSFVLRPWTDTSVIDVSAVATAVSAAVCEIGRSVSRKKRTIAAVKEPLNDELAVEAGEDEAEATGTDDSSDVDGELFGEFSANDVTSAVVSTVSAGAAARGATGVVGWIAASVQVIDRAVSLINAGAAAAPNRATNSTSSASKARTTPILGETLGEASRTVAAAVALAVVLGALGVAADAICQLFYVVLDAIAPPPAHPWRKNDAGNALPPKSALSVATVLRPFAAPTVKPQPASSRTTSLVVESSNARCVAAAARAELTGSPLQLFLGVGTAASAVAHLGFAARSALLASDDVVLAANLIRRTAAAARHALAAAFYCPCNQCTNSAPQKNLRRLPKRLGRKDLLFLVIIKLSVSLRRSQMLTMGGHEEHLAKALRLSQLITMTAVLLVLKMSGPRCMLRKRLRRQRRENLPLKLAK